MPGEEGLCKKDVPITFVDVRHKATAISVHTLGLIEIVENILYRINVNMNEDPSKSTVKDSKVEGSPNLLSDTHKMQCQTMEDLNRLETLLNDLKSKIVPNS
jgi:hypothetical protein